MSEIIGQVKLDAGYIKAGVLNVAAIQTAESKPKLRLAFVGYNTEQTRRYFRLFAQDNAEQIHSADLDRGRIRLYDGTEIRMVTHTEQVRRDGVRFDQIILADDRRRAILRAQAQLLEFIDIYGCRYSEIPQEFRFQFYDLDAPAPSRRPVPTIGG